MESSLTKTKDWNHYLYEACKKGRKDLVLLMIETLNNIYGQTNDSKQTDLMVELSRSLLRRDKPLGGIPRQVWDMGMMCACMKGHKDIVMLMIERGANNWSGGMAHACANNHKEIVDMMISYGAGQELNWNLGLDYACSGGHMNLVLLMIEKGANSWNTGLINACSGGHKEIVSLMIENGANDWNWGLVNACEGGHKELVLLMIDKWKTCGSKRCERSLKWNDGLANACDGGHNELMMLMIEHGADINSCKTSLPDSHIYYLVQRGMTEKRLYGKYQKIVFSFRESRINLPVILACRSAGRPTDILNYDLISMIMEF